jgi:hypothetical protein
MSNPNDDEGRLVADPDSEKAAEALEQRIRPGDCVGLDDGVVAIIQGPSTAWWRARKPDGTLIDLDIHNDPLWIKHQPRNEAESITSLWRIVQRYRAFVQETSIIDEIEKFPGGAA